MRINMFINYYLSDIMSCMQPKLYVRHYCVLNLGVMCTVIGCISTFLHSVLCEYLCKCFLHSLYILCKCLDRNVIPIISCVFFIVNFCFVHRQKVVFITLTYNDISVLGGGSV